MELYETLKNLVINKVVTDSDKLDNENKQLKRENEMLSNQYKSLNADYIELVQALLTIKKHTNVLGK